MRCSQVQDQCEVLVVVLMVVPVSEGKFTLAQDAQDELSEF